jgi:hypothetical protein
VVAAGMAHVRFQQLIVDAAYLSQERLGGSSDFAL